MSHRVVISKRAALVAGLHEVRRAPYNRVIMCGRYVSPDEASIEREFMHTEWQFSPCYNVAPTKNNSAELVGARHAA
jgi:hypothetical protein